MKIFKSTPYLFYCLFLVILALDFIGGIWHYLTGLFFDFEYINAVQNLGALFSSIFIIWMMKADFKETYCVFITSVKNFKKNIKASILIFLSTFISYLIVLSFFQNFDRIKATINIISFQAEVSFLAKFFLTWIVLIIAEEIIFRGFLLNALIKKLEDQFLGIIISSAIFSLSHFQYQSWLDFVSAFWGGIIMSLLFINYKSIYPSFFFHLGWNLSCHFYSIDSKNPLIDLEFLSNLKVGAQILELCILLIISIFLAAIFLKKIISYFAIRNEISREATKRTI